MKILLIHSDWIEWEATKKAIKNPEEIEEKKKKIEDVLVVFIAAEKEDESDPEKISENAVEQILKVRDQVKAKRVVIYPYAHLSSNLASPNTGFEILKEIEGILAKKKIEVYRAPFGWYKAFKISAKGHPLSELSREISVESDKERGGKQPKFKQKERKEKEVEEYKEHDHRRIGKDLELFMFHETSPGSPYWLPKGMIILNELIEFWRKEHAKRGYHEIASPLINKKELWETSGHWAHYKDDMFIADMGENEVYGIKPMNCPNAMVVFGSRTRSYKDLPLRLSDTDILHRYELSGVLSGLLRVRAFRQDDSHNFITEDQIEEEYNSIFEIVERFYSIFNLKYKFRLGTRPEKFLGERKIWDKAEESLKKILDKRVGKGKYLIANGDGAFYGPKVDILMTDALGREWQMGTIQLDFQLPQRFNLKYVGKDGKEETPVVIHRVVYGSLERFIGILLEHTRGHLPLWLSPTQISIIPITERNEKYAESIYEKLRGKFRVELKTGSETLQHRIRNAQIQKIPYMIVVGDREENDKNIAVRSRKEKQEMMKTDKFIRKLEKEIEEKV